MSRRSQGWVVVAFGVVLFVLGLTFDDLWEQITETLLGAAVIVVGLGMVAFGGTSKPSDGLAVSLRGLRDLLTRTFPCIPPGDCGWARITPGRCR